MENLAIANQMAIPRIWTNIDLETESGRALAAACMSPADLRLTDIPGQPITIKNVFIEEVEFKDGTTGHRTVIVDMNNRIYQSSSSAICNAITKLNAIYSGNLKGLTVKVKPFNTQNGFKAYTLVPDFSDIATQTEMCL